MPKVAQLALGWLWSPVQRSPMPEDAWPFGPEERSATGAGATYRFGAGKSAKGRTGRVAAPSRTDADWAHQNGLERVTHSGLLEDSLTAGVWPDSVQVLGGDALNLDPPMKSVG